MTRLHAPVAFVSGALLTLAFPEPDLWPLAWVAIAPFLWAARAAGARQGALLGLLFGLGFFGVLLIWIKYVGWIAWAILLLLQLSFVVVFGALWGVVTKHLRGFVAALFAAALWVVLEFLRQSVPTVGFTWGQLAQSQHDFLWILKWAKAGGGWAVTFFCVLVNALLLAGIEAYRERRRSIVAVCAVSIALVFVLPIADRPDRVDGVRAKVAIVQGNVPRVFSGTITEKDYVILENHARLTRQLAAEGVDLVIWPESSVGLDLNRLPFVKGTVASAARTAGAEMIVGGNQDVGTDKYKVLAYHFDRTGNVVDVYQKTHLVPFGEYVPWRGLVGWLPMLRQIPRDAIPGDRGKLFDTQVGRVAPVISFEGDFGSLVRERIAAGGGLVVVATNTSTWETSWASAQHLAFSQVNAVANGVWVAHAALSGTSAFIREDGSVVSRSELWESTTLIEDNLEMAPVSPTFYSRTGDWLPFVCGYLVVMGLGLVWVKRSVTVPQDEPI